MAESITVLNRKRGGLKKQLTKIGTFLCEVERAGNVDAVELDVKLSKLKEISSHAEDLRHEYYKVAKDQDLDLIETSLEEIEAEISDSEVSLKKLYNSLGKDKESDISTLTKVNIKLPEIPLPKFAGKIEEWNLFKKQFLSIISSYEHLSEAHKLYYLQSCLVGNAKQLQTVDDSFTSLYKALETRFDNKRLIVNTHINELLNLEKIHNENANDFRVLIDQIEKHLRALKLMDLNLDKLSEVFLINVIFQKLDKESQKQFEMSLNSNELIKWDTFQAFLQRRCQILENIHAKSKSNFLKNKSRVLVAKVNSSISCIVCKKSHIIQKCEIFNKLNPIERFELIKKHALCINCFSPTHKLASCRSRNCSVCHLKHNDLLHRTDGRSASPENENKQIEGTPPLRSPSANQNQNNRSGENADSLESSACLFSKSKTAILSTAIVWVRNIYGQYVKAKAVLDSGSQTHFATSDFINRANLRITKINVPVSSLGGTITTIKSQASATITNGNGSFSASINFLVVPRITDMVPSKKIDLQNLEIPPRSILADPDFDSPSKIDMLLGAERYFDILKAEQIRFSSNSLVFQNTVFGYIASGSIEDTNNSVSYCGLATQHENIEKTIEKFWIVENINDDKRILSKEEEFCELHFKETHRRNQEGRFIVTMPINNEKLGESKPLANRRLNHLIKRLDKDPTMKNLYSDFIAEYENLDHMEKVYDTVDGEMTYYMPHHGVYKPEKSSTQLRVVFNASAATTSGNSLNDLLLAGAVREDIFEIMIRFREFKFAFTADIKKMYRQILIDESQRDLLRILWKTRIDEPTVAYRLKTVTYGTKSAPFLAIRTLMQLAEDNSEKFPLAAEAIFNNSYMDDIVAGAGDLETAKELQAQLIEILQSCKMHLHKWHSNSSELLNCSSNQPHEHHFKSDVDCIVKTLGTIWKSQEDQFCFKLSIAEKSLYTKRDVLSTIARLYDPLGFIGPVIVKAKIFLQKLWIDKLNWDDPLSGKLASEWQQFVSELKHVEEIKIDRYILVDNAIKVTLRGFSDASESAYGAAVYLESRTTDNVTSHLLASKSRVSPLKVISIPRLELCACLLLSQLTTKVCSSLKLPIDEIILYTDSTIALEWIKTPPHRLKCFVGNRVSKIQSLTSSHQWRHVTSNNNPADVISRGLFPKDLVQNEMWWHGLLVHTDSERSDRLVPMKDIQKDIDCEMKNPSTDLLTLNVTSGSFITDFLNLSNSYLRLIRILSFIFRFLRKCRKETSKFGPLDPEELNSSELFLVKSVQTEQFPKEIKSLKISSEIPTMSQIKQLNPFLDDHGLLRVNGRLGLIDLNVNKRFPLILPSKHKLTYLIVEYYHRKYLHVGPQALLHHLRDKFWIVNGRSICRKVVHQCLTCYKVKPVTAQQIMGNLPKERATKNFPFLISGVDFCGPFYIKYRNQRKGTFNKIYVCIFICFVTKAMHLELVTDLTSAAFIATLKRFIARRGKCVKLVTDNATNFIGANIEIKRLHKLVSRPDDTLAGYLSSENIDWKFLPPRAPNFGGLWEAGVKSIKYHLKRVVGNTRLTYEEFLTIVTQVEGILNSRPLIPLSADLDDLQVLTPAHFLVGRPINFLVEPNLTATGDNKLTLWQKTTKLTQQIWKRWANSYLNTLQQRSKWHLKKDNVKIGDLVIIKEDNVAICDWPLGRITEVFLGPDDNVRVVTVKTQRGSYKRPISKICLLPFQE